MPTKAIAVIAIIKDFRGSQSSIRYTVKEIVDCLPKRDREIFRYTIIVFIREASDSSSSIREVYSMSLTSGSVKALYPDLL